MNKALAQGKVDPRVEDTLIGGAKGALGAIKMRNSRADIAELRRMLEEAKEVQRRGIAREVAERQHLIP